MNKKHTPAKCANPVEESILGVQQLLRSDPAEALHKCDRFLETHPNEPWHLLHKSESLGAIRNTAGDLETLRCCVSANPAFEPAARILASLLSKDAKYDEAIRILSDLIARSKGSGGLHGDLGRYLHAAKNYDAAERHHRIAIERSPLDASSYSNLGASLKELNRPSEAVEVLRTAIELDPELLEARVNLCSILFDLKDYEAAILYAKSALRLNDESAVAWYNLGLAYNALARYEEAESAYKRAIHLRPNWADALNNLSVSLTRQGKLAESIPYLEMSLDHDEFHINSHRNKSMKLLQFGELLSGFSEYEWRLESIQSERIPEERQWDGSPLENIQLLVSCEQGFGDTIQFARYIPLVRKLVPGVRFAVQGGLEDLVASSGLETCPIVRSVGGELTPHVDADKEVRLMSLPKILGTTLETIPSRVPYLSSEKVLVDLWRSRIDELTDVPTPTIKAGIVWAGNSEHLNDQNRSASLSAFSTLFDIPGIQWFSLQKGTAAQQLAPDYAVTITDLGSEFVTFAETAAALQSLDIIISVDTSIVHLAGALALPVWNLLSRDSDWRWLLDRSDSPWYPTMRLFRQENIGDWQPVFRDVERELRRLVNNTLNSVPAMLETFKTSLANGDLVRAREVASAIEQVDPSDYQTLNEMGVCYWNNGRVQEGLQMLTSALALCPEDRIVVLNCADVFEAFGQVNEASAVLHGYLARHPHDIAITARRLALAQTL